MNLADSIKQGGLSAKASSLALTLIEVGTLFLNHFRKIVKSQFSICYMMYFWVCHSGKACQSLVLELVGRDTMDLLDTKTGIDIEKDDREVEKDGNEEQFFLLFYLKVCAFFFSCKSLHINRNKNLKKNNMPHFLDYSSLTFPKCLHFPIISDLT